MRQRATRWIRGIGQNINDNELTSSYFATHVLPISLDIEGQGDEETPEGLITPPQSPPPAEEEEKEEEMLIAWVPRPSSAPEVLGPAPVRVEEEQIGEDEDEDEGEWEGDWTSVLEDYE